MSLTLTDNAANYIKEFAGEHRLRISAQVNSGKIDYRADIITRILENDHVYESRGVIIVVDSHSIPFIDGTEIDYVKEGAKIGFQYNNPQENNEFK